MSNKEEIQGIIKLMEQYEQGQKEMNKVNNVEPSKFSELEADSPEYATLQLKNGEVLNLHYKSTAFEEVKKAVNGEETKNFIRLGDGVNMFSASEIAKFRDIDEHKLQEHLINQNTTLPEDEKKYEEELKKEADKAFNDNSDSGMKEFSDGSYRGDK
ncbi:hypothetical protein [Halobacillus sp. K22]|uniref:hypothetical protein n=1 Tax=Halobacillus sp. K22 TaxID=3457431 RepID=UPI003FCDDAF2